MVHQDPSTGPPDTPATPAVLRGMLTPSTMDGWVANRRLVLCAVEIIAHDFPLDCTVTEFADTTLADGSFAIEGAAPGYYLVLYETGLSDFGEAYRRWVGSDITLGDWPWLRDAFYNVQAGDVIDLAVAEETGSIEPEISPVDYAVQTLQLEGSPFTVAHRIVSRNDAAVVELVIVSLPVSPTGSLAIPVLEPISTDYDSLRAEIGVIAPAEMRLLEGELAGRWEQFLSGDDEAYRATDADTIRAVRSGEIQPIGNTVIAAIEEYGDRLIKQPGYATIDTQTGERIAVGWLAEESHDVIEAATSYRLNVLDPPGEWIQTGAGGEQLYHYGFSYFRPWGRLLPDPIIGMINRFHTQGAAHAELFLVDYQEAEKTFGGDMRRLAWDGSTAQSIRTWKPANLLGPYAILPDSGTVDVRRERFLEAIVEGKIVIDEVSLAAYLASTEAATSYYLPSPDPQAVRDALLTPYRSGHLFNDMEAAVILAATYSGEGPLVIEISRRVEQGFQVPRSSKRIFIAHSEVANVILGYPGTLNGRWAHEMGHIIDFRAPQAVFSERPRGYSRCEPLKYMMEYMWWVERYTYDAPAFDWMPISSGLTLSRLLNEYYPNSGC